MNFKERLKEELNLNEIQANTLLNSYVNVCEKLAKEYHKEQLIISGVVKSLRDEMTTGFAQTKMQVWDGELTNKHREKMLEDWIRRNGDDLTIAEHIVKDAYFLADEMLRLR